MKDGQTAGELAGKKFKEGYNCAETVLRTFRDALNLDLSDDALKIATGFGGGLGHAGCMCGALSGAIMVLSMLQGRTSADQSRDAAYSGAKEFHQAFSQAFGGTCCRVLNKDKFGSREQGVRCLKITAATADLLMEMIEKNGLSKGLQEAGQ